ncbi:GntR family transcriptional regulator [Sciscionella sediminilitoris]|uniref:GntR family transcriptional regulator n=1 Tax=Sciscionella sediminilitoris TaxID=1445613 RepID=UPI0004DFC221|nr:GntR family transcriptional regulator [Sciscionella sp. SE31]
MELDVEPVARESTAGIIARQLRAAITTGSLAPGAQLGEAELANQFQVSRGPLREAMQRLVQEGLLRSEPHRGLFVVDLEPEDVYDLYAARTAIESAAAIRVIRADPRPVGELWTAHERMTSAADREDPAAVSDADLEFHERLVALSGSKRLARMMRTLMVETRMCLTALQRTYADVRERVSEHGAIIEAIAEGDERLATALLERHMEDAVRRLAPGTSLFTSRSEG